MEVKVPNSFRKQTIIKGVEKMSFIKRRSVNTVSRRLCLSAANHPAVEGSSCLSRSPDIIVTKRIFDGLPGVWQSANASFFQIWGIEREPVF